ncbi:hypothetical protein [Spirosoma foliorum]|uniref:hypothetical protein n=1 Tax=Spirosoma foliorum TaxID=2710596 RepID=UPI001F0A51E9|nr:hypothetical protein [Spirosoma foliorum]
MTNSIVAQAQLIVGGVNIDTLNIQYIELIGYKRSSLETSVWIDFGRGFDGYKASEFLKPINNHQSVRFFSIVEALNYVYKNGWELVTIDGTSTVPSSTVYHRYILRRRNQAVKQVNQR